MFLLAMDLEATCFGGPLEREPMEIIEFPAILIGREDYEIKDIFHHYVKPTRRPILSDFCKNLTGIAQETVDASLELPEVLKLFQEWTDSKGIHPGNCTLITFGSWDIKRAIPNACAAVNRPIPKILDLKLTGHANLKKICLRETGTLPTTIPHIMANLNLEFKGKEHSELDDTYNIVETIRNAKNWNITPTN